MDLPLPRRALPRGLAGFAFSLALWWVATPGYDGFLAVVAEPVLRLLESPAVTRLTAEGRRVLVDRSDFPSDSPRPALPADNFTFNVILFGTLAATTPRLLSDRGVARLAASAGLLAAGHVASLVCAVKSLYALELGEWSSAHYGALSRNLWATAAHFDRFVGSFALAFLLWWALIRPLGEVSGERPAKRRRKLSTA